MLEAANGLIQRSHRWFPSYGGHYNSQKHYWLFPSGARVYFGHMQHEDDRFLYQGAEFAYIAFDELTEFTETQYTYMFTRCRVPNGLGLRAYVRSATNPGNIGHEWVKRRFVTRDIVNQLRYFAMVEEEDIEVEKAYTGAFSRAFYPAVLDDNPTSDPDYEYRLMLDPDPVQRARLRWGNWDITSTEGRVYPNWGLENISTDAEYNPDLPVMWGVDDGYAQGQGRGSMSYHPRVVLLAQMNSIGGLNVFAEYVATLQLSEMTLDTLIGKVGEDEKEYTGWPYKAPEVAYVDSSAAELKARIWERGIQTVGATHPVNEGIKNLRRLICDGNGVRLIKVHPRCKELIRSMELYRNDPHSHVANVGEPKPLKLDDHEPDAMRYLAWPLRYE